MFTCLWYVDRYINVHKCFAIYKGTICLHMLNRKIMLNLFFNRSIVKLFLLTWFESNKDIIANPVHSTGPDFFLLEIVFLTSPVHCYNIWKKQNYVTMHWGEKVLARSVYLSTLSLLDLKMCGCHRPLMILFRSWAYSLSTRLI